MSIVAMKNKSRGYNNPISGKKYTGFSLNGSLRSQGYVGQDSISRKSIKTPFKGNYPVGNGGHLGSYNINPIFSCSECVNDPSIIKKSTVDNLGYISNIKSKNIIPAVLMTSIQENTVGNYISSQSDYIQILRTTRDASSSSCKDSDLPKIATCNNNTSNKNKKCGSYAKPLATISAGDYMNFIIYNKKCVSN